MLTQCGIITDRRGRFDGARGSRRGPATGCVIVRCGVCNSPAAYFSVNYEGYRLLVNCRVKVGAMPSSLRRPQAAGAAFGLRGAPRWRRLPPPGYSSSRRPGVPPISSTILSMHSSSAGAASEISQSRGH
ncbi:hypothetical protein OKW33_001742 [Paraburkholderia atlantica]